MLLSAFASIFRTLHTAHTRTFTRIRCIAYTIHTMFITHIPIGIQMLFNIADRFGFGLVWFGSVIPNVYDVSKSWPVDIYPPSIQWKLETVLIHHPFRIIIENMVHFPKFFFLFIRRKFVIITQKPEFNFIFLSNRMVENTVSNRTKWTSRLSSESSTRAHD